MKNYSQRWLITFSLLLFFSQNVLAQKEIHSGTLNALLPLESFESATFPPAGWTKQTDFDGAGWRRGEIGSPMLGFASGTIDAPENGGNFVAFASWWTGDADSSFNTDQPTEQWLITPQLTLIEDGDSLAFSVKHFSSFVDSLDIVISRTRNDSIAFFDTTLFEIGFDSSSTNTWQRYSISLGGFAGDSIYVAFREHVFSTFNRGDAILLDLVEVNSLVTSVNSRPPVAEGFALFQNYPNPFNPTTRIAYALPKDATVTLQVYNLLGQVVATLLKGEQQTQGEYAVTFDASSLPNGIYFYKIEANNFTEVRQMALVR